MAVDDGLDKIEAQPDTVFIQRTGTVRFVKPVKDIRQVIGRDGLPFIPDGNIGFFIFDIQADRDAAALPGKLHRIIQQVINDLGNSVLICMDHHPVIRKLGIHIQMLCIGQREIDMIKGKRVLLVDDVISTGESLRSLENLVERAGGNIVGRFTVLAEGDALGREDITYLEELPVFNPDGTVKK